jgi:hypothetical protein
LLVFKICLFKCNLYRYTTEPLVPATPKTAWAGSAKKSATQEDWYSPWRLFSPWEWDMNLSNWKEPLEPEGQPLAPYMERVCYYLAVRHPVMTCLFVKEKDSFSRNERIAAFIVTILNTWWVSVIMTKS